MKKQINLILCCILFASTFSGFSQKVIFLHHSTGAGVYSEGKVAKCISDYNNAHGTNYNITERSFPYTPYPWENYPYDYWNLWINNACNNADPDIECLGSLCASYDIIIFKHCFPGADILADDASPSISSSKKTLANYKLQYRALRDLMDTYPNNKFIVWTLAPEHRLATNPQDAQRARQFVDWVKNEWLSEDGKAHPNIYVFDFFNYVAESDPTPANGEVNCLKYEYEGSHIGSDSHPNTIANETVGPLFAQFIVHTIEDTKPIKVTGITLAGAGNETTITTNGGTLQLSVDVTPANATNKSVAWSIQNATGQASISTSGLVTAIADGTVTATATANDGSGISGNLVIAISNQIISVTGIAVTGEDGKTTITTNGGTLQLSAEITPEDATNKTITWSIHNETGQALISTSGLVTAIANGTVNVTATANDGSEITGNLIITISGQTILVTEITVTGKDSTTFINTLGGTLQMLAEVKPDNASNNNIEWSIEDLSGSAAIDNSGFLTAISNGSVKVIASALDESNISGYCLIGISNQLVDLNSKNFNNQELVAFVSSNILHIGPGSKIRDFNYCSVYSISGIIIYKEKILNDAVSIDISSYPSGVYIVSLAGSDLIIPIKVIISR
jgi:uncharacterized protein YjdB